MYLKTEIESVDLNTAPPKISVLDKLNLKTVENEKDLPEVDEKADADDLENFD